MSDMSSLERQANDEGIQKMAQVLAVSIESGLTEGGAVKAAPMMALILCFAITAGHAVGASPISYRAEVKRLFDEAFENELASSYAAIDAYEKERTNERSTRQSRLNAHGAPTTKAHCGAGHSDSRPF